MDQKQLAALIDQAMKRQGFRYKSNLSEKLGFARNYVQKLLDGSAKPSEEAIAELHKLAGVDPTMPVLEFLSAKHSGDVKRIIDRAIKALSAAAIAALILVSAPSIDTAQAGNSEGLQSVYYV